MLLAGTPVLYVGDSLNRSLLNLQPVIRGSRGAAGIGARALRADRLLFRAARVRTTSLFGTIDLGGWSLDMLVVRAARTGVVALCWSLVNWDFVLRTARLGAFALDGRLFGGLVLEATRACAGDRR